MTTLHTSADDGGFITPTPEPIPAALVAEVTEHLDTLGLDLIVQATPHDTFLPVLVGYRGEQYPGEVEVDPDLAHRLNRLLVHFGYNSAHSHTDGGTIVIVDVEPVEMCDCPQCEPPQPSGYVGVDSVSLLVIDPSWLPAAAEAIAMDYVGRGMAVLVNTCDDGIYPVLETRDGILIRPVDPARPLWIAEGTDTDETLYLVTSEDGRTDVLSVAEMPGQLSLVDMLDAHEPPPEPPPVVLDGPVIPTAYVGQVADLLTAFGYWTEAVEVSPTDHVVTAARFVGDHDEAAEVNVPRHLAPFVNAVLRWGGGQVYGVAG